MDELILERPAKDKEKPHADFLTVWMDYEELVNEETGEFSWKFYPPVVDTLMAFDRVLDWGFPKEEQNLYATWYVITEHKDSKLAELHWDRPEVAETAVEFSNVTFAFNGIIYQKKDRKDQAYPRCGTGMCIPSAARPCSLQSSIVQGCRRAMGRLLEVERIPTTRIAPQGGGLFLPLPNHPDGEGSGVERFDHLAGGAG